MESLIHPQIEQLVVKCFVILNGPEILFHALRGDEIVYKTTPRNTAPKRQLSKANKQDTTMHKFYIHDASLYNV
ncbi:hypothetical protein VNO80_17489 [Phaseolus coccineus]|uniref:Uncharacterized protein n=1 Tax=Phaseolus coccineus TaxID=3886 RepID=A0AAN9MIM3_PHACN